MSVRDNNDPRRKLVITDFDALLRMLIKDGTARNTGRHSFLMGRRIPYELPRGFGQQFPRFMYGPKTQRNDKYVRYRHKKLKAGLCPRCGRKCHPFHYCNKCREYKRINTALCVLVRRGEIVRTECGLYAANTNP